MRAGYPLNRRPAQFDMIIFFLTAKAVSTVIIKTEPQFFILINGGGQEWRAFIGGFGEPQALMIHAARGADSAGGELLNQNFVFMAILKAITNRFFCSTACGYFPLTLTRQR
ncbi:hypothetical protein D3C71_1875880 [compost metagenome]